MVAPDGGGGAPSFVIARERALLLLGGALPSGPGEGKRSDGALLLLSPEAILDRMDGAQAVAAAAWEWINKQHMYDAAHGLQT